MSGLSVRPINPMEEARWIDFVSRHPSGTVFHHPRWMRVLTESYGYTPESLGVFHGDTVVGVLPLLAVRSILTGSRLVSLPFSDLCAPIADSNEITALLVAEAAVLIRQRGWRYLELRGGNKPDGFAVSALYKHHGLDLSKNPEDIFRSFDKSQTQRSIRKAEKSGMKIEHRVDWEAMQVFMRLNYRTRRKHGLPPQPDRFFARFQKNIIDNGLGFVSIASEGGSPVGAAVFLHFGRTVHYKYGASDEARLQNRPNHAILWSAIRWGCEQGFQTFDLGRSDVDGEGLLKYKRGWGTREHDLHYFRLSKEPEKGGTSQVESLKPILRRMPIAALKVIGRILYEHIG